MTKPIELYYWPTPNGWKITIFLEEAKIPYDIKYINIGAGDQFKPKFLEIAPNNRMPAIIDHDGPNGKPIAVFESGAILQYLAQKIGRFYPQETRQKTQVDQWLFWQMGGLGPMAGQAHHFRQYAPENVPYGIERYTNEVNRLYGVLNKQLEKNKWIAGEEYSIADMACFPWIIPYERQGQDLNEFKYLKKWFDNMKNRKAVEKGVNVGKEEREKMNLATDEEAQKIMFGQKARK